MGDLTPIIRVGASLLGIAMFLVATALPLLAFIGVALGRKVQWDYVIVVTLLLYALAPITAAFGPRMLTALNESWENSEVEMERFEENMVEYYSTKTAGSPTETPSFLPPTPMPVDTPAPTVVLYPTDSPVLPTVAPVPTVTPMVVFPTLVVDTPVPTLDMSIYNVMTPAPTPQ